MGGYQPAADVLKAMAHPIRIQILQVLLTEGEACVCHLEATLGQRQAYISQQLATLREVGLVTDRREGLNVYYAPTSIEVGELLHKVQDLVIDLALVDSNDIDYSSTSVDDRPDCGCPKCELEQSSSSYQIQEKLEQPISEGRI